MKKLKNLVKSIIRKLGINIDLVLFAIALIGKRSLQKENTTTMQLSKELHELFKLAPPERLKKSLYELYFNYIGTAEELHHDFREISSDIYFLINFLEKIKKE